MVLYFVEEDRVLECWICYDPDRTDVGPMINPCECRGDVSAVHHDCLQRWLMEVSALVNNPFYIMNIRIQSVSMLILKLLFDFSTVRGIFRCTKM